MGSPDDGKGGKDRWLRDRFRPSLKTVPPAQKTPAGLPVAPLYAPSDLPEGHFEAHVGYPGEYPFTRGIYPSMYLGRPWTMRQYAGFGTAEESNRRYRFLLSQGQTGLSVALDLPTQVGLDPEDPMAEDDVGRLGVSVATLRDMEILFEGIPLDRISTSFTINATAPVLLAMYQAVGEAQGVGPDKLSGTVQNDLLKEFIARGLWVFPVEPSLRLVCDVVEYCSKTLPRFNPISVAGHMREAGASAVQEAAYVLANALTYVDRLVRRGLDIDSFAHQLSFFFWTYTDLFEEVAKYRAMRRLWARLMKDRFGARKPESWMFRLAVVCGGVSLSSAEPMNNIIRVAYEALASALAGCQSLFTNAWDEAYTIPTEETALTALRTQQILMHETGVTRTIDPLGGSYYVETLTDATEKAIEAEMKRVEGWGGMVRAIEQGLVQKAILEEAYRQQRSLESGEKVVVGLNRYAREGTAREVENHPYDASVVRRRSDQVAEVRSRRDGRAVRETLDRLRETARGSDNLMPVLVQAVKAYATVGEIMRTLKDVFGTYRQPDVL